MRRLALLLVLLSVGSAVAHADSKKQALLADKAAAPRPPATYDKLLAKRIGKPPGRVLNLRNIWTKETLALEPKPGMTLAAPLLGSFLRCHFTNQPTEMDGRLIRVLVDAARHFDATQIDIVSGFRAPKYNLMLRKKGREVARDSQHTHGNAVDFRIPGVGVRALEA